MLDGRPGELGIPLPGASLRRRLVTSSGRRDAWGGAIRQAAQRPIVGYGFGTEARAFIDRWSGFVGSVPENSYIGLALQLGVVGLVVFALLVSSLLAAGVDALFRHGVGVGFPGGTYDQPFYVADAEAEGPWSDHEVTGYLAERTFALAFPVRRRGLVRFIVSSNCERNRVSLWYRPRAAVFPFGTSPLRSERKKLRSCLMTWISRMSVTGGGFLAMSSERTPTAPDHSTGIGTSPLACAVMPT